MRNPVLHNPAWIKAKAILFLLAGTAASALLLVQRPTLKTSFLLIVALWSFCRLYYFAFYVVERYLDPAYKFSGLISVLRYTLQRPNRMIADSRLHKRS